MGLSRRRIALTVGEGALVTVAVAALGRVIQGPLGGWPAEDVINVRLAGSGSPTWDRMTWVLSTYSDVVPTVATALGLAAWQHRRGAGARRMWGPLTAAGVETLVFTAAAAVVGRPRPDVRRLDRPAPTSSFPSGHTGASTALHLMLADALAEAGTPRPVAASIRVCVPPAVGLSRLYRGMHHPSDVVVGMLVGAWSARATRRLLSRP